MQLCVDMKKKKKTVIKIVNTISKFKKNKYRTIAVAFHETKLRDMKEKKQSDSNFEQTSWN